MIQRVQSIYLLVAAIGAIVLMCIPAGNFVIIPVDDSVTVGAGYGCVYNAFSVKFVTNEPTRLMSTVYIGIMLAISAFFSLISIFLYKNRDKQIKMNYVNMLIFLVSIILMLVVYPDHIFVKKGWIASSQEIQYNYWIILFIIITIGVIYLANRAIKKDDKKVKEADRLR